MDIKDEFHKVRDAIIKSVGRVPMASEDIDKIGNDLFKKKWGGVYPQDDVPKLKNGHYYIINTGFKNGHGAHWLAIAVSKSGIPHIWDSFARNPNTLIWKETQKIRGSGVIPISVNHKADQHSQSVICGHLSLAWLIMVKSKGLKRASLI